jgi:Holliday junction resolvase RusA-like endonuclease
VKQIQFFAQGIPKGQPRPRAFSRGGSARVYDPGTAEGWKSQIAMAAREHVPHAPLSGPVKLRLQFHIPRPKSHLRANGELKPTAPYLNTKKPDADNYAKAVMDALTTLRFWQDDAQVAELSVRKAYSTQAGCLIEIAECVE